MLDDSSSPVRHPLRGETHVGHRYIDGRTEGIFDHIGLVFEEKLVAVGADAMLRVSVSNEPELARLRAFRDRMRKLPAEIVEFADWEALGADLGAGGFSSRLWPPTWLPRPRPKQTRTGLSKPESGPRQKNRSSEPSNSTPPTVPAGRPLTLPARCHAWGRGFGTVFRCLDTEDVDDAGNPIVVAIKALRSENLDRDPRVVFAEARTLRDLHREGSRIIRVTGSGYAYADPDDPNRKARPYIVMEYFPGEALGSHCEPVRPAGCAGFPGSGPADRGGSA